MRFREQAASIGKIHTSVQTMLAEARKIVKPSHIEPPSYISSNSHLELHLPAGQINEYLKQMLYNPPQSYKKMDRKQRLSLIQMQDKQEVQGNTSLSQSKLNSPLMLTRLTERYQLKGVMNNFESELVDQKFHQYIRRSKRPLCSKKTVSLPLPQELPSLKQKSRSARRGDESLLEKIRNAGPRYFLSMTEDDIIKARDSKEAKQYKTIEPPESKRLEAFILSPDAGFKTEIQDQLKERIAKRQSGKPRKLAQFKAKQKDNPVRQVIEEQKYSPWDLQVEEGELIF